MLIAVTGYGSTGASAYVDVLKEYNNVKHINEEFSFLHYGDGLLNLKEAICYGNRLQVETTLLRFKNNIGSKRNKNFEKITNGKFVQLTEEYFKKVANIEWDGSCVDDPDDLMPWNNKKKYKIFREIYKAVLPLLGKNKKTAFLHKRYFSNLSEKEFNQITHEYLQNLFYELGIQDEENILAEQVFNPAQPLAGMEFFDGEILSLIVDRDPRDVYLLTNVIFPELNRYMPCNGKVEDFVDYYRVIHKAKIEDRRVKYVQYEDLIYDYEQTVMKISKWLPALQQINKGKYFKPEYSINNTQLWEKYPQYSDDIQYIEKKLPEMLYDFNGKENKINFQKVETQPFENQCDVD